MTPSLQTPKTDAEEFDSLAGFTSNEKVVPSKLARQLERELSDLQQSILDLSHPNIREVLKDNENLETTVTYWKEQWNKQTIDRDRLQAELAEAKANVILWENEILRLSGLLRVSNTERNDAAQALRDVNDKLAASEQREAGLREALALCKDLLPRGLDAKEWTAIKAALSLNKEKP